MIRNKRFWRNYKGQKDRKSQLVILMCIGLVAMVALAINIQSASADDCDSEDYHINDKPTIETITVSPEKPYPLSTITFTAEITGYNIQEVSLIISEMVGECSHPCENISMENIYDEIYECNVTLLYADSTDFMYWPVVKCNGIWYDFRHERYYHDLYPELSIIAPEEGYFYFMEKQIRKTFFGSTVLIGRTTIKIDIGFYNFNYIEKVEFCLNEKLMETVKEKPFEWHWNTFSYGRNNLEIKAYVSESNYSNINMRVIAFIL